MATDIAVSALHSDAISQAVDSIISDHGGAMLSNGMTMRTRPSNIPNPVGMVAYSEADHMVEIDAGGTILVGADALRARGSVAKSEQAQVASDSVCLGSSHLTLSNSHLESGPISVLSEPSVLQTGMVTLSDSMSQEREDQKTSDLQSLASITINGQPVFIMNRNGQLLPTPETTIEGTSLQDKNESSQPVVMEMDYQDQGVSMETVHVVGETMSESTHGVARVEELIDTHTLRVQMPPTSVEVQESECKPFVGESTSGATSVAMQSLVVAGGQVTEQSEVGLGDAHSEMGLISVGQAGAPGSGVQGFILNAGNASQLRGSGGNPIQVVSLSEAADLFNGSARIFHLVPTNQLQGAVGDGESFMAVSKDAGGGAADATNSREADSKSSLQSSQGLSLMAGNRIPDTIGSILIAPGMNQNVQHVQKVVNLPPGTPPWGARLNDCEKIGDSFRGWVENEVELDLLLTYHKQQTQSFWGTRQSPSPAKQSTRLMWKSQYVPFDGLPFVNSGSRAIVLECQYGPRRKGAQAKKGVEESQGIFRQTCPARIYVKKVRKFPEFSVDSSLDKKFLKLAMDKAFQLLRERGTEDHGQERFYVQLPMDTAHEFHGEIDLDGPRRLHPTVATKIRELVSCGETRLYAIRKMLRRFVEKELFAATNGIPEKHNLTYFPTVNDLQNHIHQAAKDIESGDLPLAAQTMNLEVVSGGDSSNDGTPEGSMWHCGTPDNPHAETVTVTLTQSSDEDGQHVISRVETHMSDGTTQVSTSLTPETAKLLSKLHPNMFPSGGLLQEQVDGQASSDSPALSLDMAQDSLMADGDSLIIKTDPHGAVTQPTDGEFALVQDAVAQDGIHLVQAIVEQQGGHLDGEDEDNDDDDDDACGLAVAMDTIDTDMVKDENGLPHGHLVYSQGTDEPVISYEDVTDLGQVTEGSSGAVGHFSGHSPEMTDNHL